MWSTGRRRLFGWRKISSWCFTRFPRSPRQRDLTALMGTLSKSEINPFYTNTSFANFSGFFQGSWQKAKKIRYIDCLKYSKCIRSFRAKDK